MVSTTDEEVAFLSISIESEPTAMSGPLAHLQLGEPRHSAAWNERVAQAQRRFDGALDRYRAELSAALAVDESQINVSAYPTLKILVGDTTEDLPLGEELFLDLFTLYAAGGWRQVEVATTAVATWSGLPPADLKAREESLPGGVDLVRGVPRAAARFYRECRRLLGEFVMQGIRDAEVRLLAEVRDRLDSAIESVSAGILAFGIRLHTVVDPVGGGMGTRQVPRMADPELGAAVHHYLVQVGEARRQMESLNARLVAVRNGAPVGSAQGGGIGSGASHGGFGGSSQPQSETELLAELDKQTRLAIEAGRQLQDNAPWAMAIAAQVTATTSEEDMLRRLDATLADIRDTAKSVRAALDHGGVLDPYLGADAETALAGAYPVGPDGALVLRAMAEVGNGQYAAVHLLCERALLDLYEDDASADGIRSVVLGRMIAELLKVAADRETARRDAQDARQKASRVNAVLGLLSFIPGAGVLGASVRLISGLSDLAMMISAAAEYSGQFDDIRRQLGVRLADEGEGDIAALGDLLAMRRDLLDDIAMDVLIMMVSRSAGRIRGLRQALFLRGVTQDVETLLDVIHADELAGP